MKSLKAGPKGTSFLAGGSGVQESLSQINDMLTVRDLKPRHLTNNQYTQRFEADAVKFKNYPADMEETNCQVLPTKKS